MKRVLTLAAIFAIVISFFACDKDVNERPNLDRTYLLTSSAWQIKHIRVVQTGQDFVYDRGGSNNTFDFTNDYLEFQKDGSGTYWAGNDQYEISWQFDNSEKSELTYTIYNYADGHPQPGTDHLVKLENVFLSETSFRYAELYTNNNGSHSAASVYRERAIK